MTTPPGTAERFRRAGSGDNTDGDAGEQGTPVLAVDTNQAGLFDVPVQQPAEGQEADMMATPGQPRQALEALSGGASEVYQPAVWEPDTPDQRPGGPTLRVGTSDAPAPPASLMPAAPALRPPAVDVHGTTAGTLYAAATRRRSVVAAGDCSRRSIACCSGQHGCAVAGAVGFGQACRPPTDRQRRRLSPCTPSRHTTSSLHSGSPSSGTSTRIKRWRST